MLKGTEFGEAIKKAIHLKIESGAARSKAEIARHFKVKPPSISDWEKKGSVSKDKLSELWRYFSDVAGPDHWGMSESEWPTGLSTPINPAARQPEAKSNERSKAEWPLDMIDEDKVRRMSITHKAQLQAAILIAAAQVGLDIKKTV